MRNLLLLPVLLAYAAGVAAAQTRIEPTKWAQHDAFRLSDGRSEIVVVPALSGRVMLYGRVGGANLLWNAPPEKLTGDGFKNWGGDKTFVGPHPTWNLFAPSIWPPRPEWDGPPHQAQIMDGALLVSGPVWAGFGTRISRQYRFNDAGELEIRQTIEKVRGGALMLSIWSVAQAQTPDAVWLPLNAASPYINGYHTFGKSNASIDAQLERVAPDLLKVEPIPGKAYKIGVDAPFSALVWAKGDMAWRVSAAKPTGDYPDGAGGAGFPVELYNHSDAGAGHYVELELLSPLRPFHPGTRWTHTVRWSLHDLPSSDNSSAANQNAVRALLSAP